MFVNFVSDLIPLPVVVYSCGSMFPSHSFHSLLPSHSLQLRLYVSRSQFATLTVCTTFRPKFPLTVCNCEQTFLLFPTPSLQLFIVAFVSQFATVN